MVHRLDAEAGENVTRLMGKVAVVTGGGTGIGRAIALAFCKERAKVGVAGRRREKLDQIVQEVRQMDGEAISLVCDVTKAQDAQQAIASTEKEFGCVNVLVNNAGALSVSTIENISEEDWDRLMATNV